MENYTKYRLKAAEELTPLLQSADNLFVIACNKCFKEFDTTQETDLEQFLELAQSLGKTIVGTAKADFLCNEFKANKALPVMIPENAENVVVISCGLGAQTVAAITDKPAIVACNSLNYTGHHGMALTKKACDACAQCYLNITGGICPVVDCSKSLLNGQCGGAKDGKCEVDPSMECGWERIQKRLAAVGRLDALKCPIQIRNYATEQDI